MGIIVIYSEPKAKKSQKKYAAQQPSLYFNRFRASSKVFLYDVILVIGLFFLSDPFFGQRSESLRS